jgi:methyltransferase (TIGR00027 family)
MKSRSLCNSMLVAEWRHIQSIHETTELRNPDTVVRHFLPTLRRWRCAWLGLTKLAMLRSEPFYYYLVARTKYYDGVFLDAISDGTQCIINVGCGSDTRSHRFQDVLTRRGIKVLECDRSEDIAHKQRIAHRRGTCDHIRYLPIDLNDGAWPALDRWLARNSGEKALVLMEGVSPYVNLETFGRFLSSLAIKLPRGSRVAYDFKLRGVADDFGRVGPGQELFRLPGIIKDVVAYHEALGFRLEHLEESYQLQKRLLPDSMAPLFMEDGLVQLRVGGC